MGRKKYSKELKAQIALDAIKGQKTIAELASEYGVRANQILWQPKDEGLFEPQRYSCKPQTDPTLDAFNGLGVSSSQAKHQQAEQGA